MTRRQLFKRQLPRSDLHTPQPRQRSIIPGESKHGWSSNLQCDWPTVAELRDSDPRHLQHGEAYKREGKPSSAHGPGFWRKRFCRVVESAPITDSRWQQTTGLRFRSRRTQSLGIPGSPVCVTDAIKREQHVGRVERGQRMAGLRGPCARSSRGGADRAQLH